MDANACREYAQEMRRRYVNAARRAEPTSGRVHSRHGLPPPAAELARRHGIRANTIRLWKDKYAGMKASCLARLKQLEEESGRKDRIISRLTLEVDAMKELVEKKRLGPSDREAGGEGLAKEKDFGCTRVPTARLHAQQSVLSAKRARRRSAQSAAE
jgi:hypothetical protein